MGGLHAIQRILIFHIEKCCMVLKNAQKFEKNTFHSIGYCVMSVLHRPLVRNICIGKRELQTSLSEIKHLVVVHARKIDSFVSSGV